MERTLLRGILENEVQAQEPSVEGEGPALGPPAMGGRDLGTGTQAQKSFLRALAQ